MLQIRFTATIRHSIHGRNKTNGLTHSTQCRTKLKILGMRSINKTYQKFLLHVVHFALPSAATFLWIGISRRMKFKRKVTDVLQAYIWRKESETEH